MLLILNIFDLSKQALPHPTNSYIFGAWCWSAFSQVFSFHLFVSDNSNLVDGYNILKCFSVCMTFISISMSRVFRDILNQKHTCNRTVSVLMTELLATYLRFIKFTLTSVIVHVVVTICQVVSQFEQCVRAGDI